MVGIMHYKQGKMSMKKKNMGGAKMGMPANKRNKKKMSMKKMPMKPKSY